MWLSGQRVVHLDLWPVGGHTRTVVVLPPLRIFLVADGHQSLVELIVHRLHTDERTASTVGGDNMHGVICFELYAVSNSSHKGSLNGNDEYKICSLMMQCGIVGIVLLAQQPSNQKAI